MTTKSINREHKDRLFKAIFGAPEHKEYALSLYNAVNSTRYQNPDDLVFYTIENAVYMGMKNDISFIFDSELNLYEQQSTFNPNMPLRGLMYLSKQYEKYVENNHLNLYRNILQQIPAPKYVVFYNGSELQPDKLVLRLSDAFIKPVDEPALEVRTCMLNINYGQNKRIMKACIPLNDYSKFIYYVKINQKRGMDVNEAVDDAIERAVSESLLDGWFAAHKAEVIGMILTEYNEEFVHKGWFQDGMEKGLAQEKQATVLRMLKAGYALDQIMLIADVDKETVEKIKNTI